MRNILKMHLTNKLYYIFFALFILALIIFALSYVSITWYNADYTLGAILGKEIAGGNWLLKDWILSTQSYFFTLYVPHAVAYALFHDMQLNMQLVIVCYLLLSFTFLMLIFKNYLPDFKVNTPLFLLVFVLFYIGTNLLEITTLNMTGHNASTIFSLLAVYLFYKKNRTIASRCALCVVVMLLVSSDKYVLVYMGAPIIIETILRWIRQKAFDKDVLIIIAGVGLAFVLNKFVFYKFGYNVPGMRTQFVAFSAFTANLEYFIHGVMHRSGASFWGKQLWSPLTFLTIFFCGFLAVMVYAHFKIRGYLSRLSVFCIISSALVVMSVLLSNATVNFISSGRYSLGMLYNGLILTVLLLATINIPAKIKSYLSYLAILLLIIVAIYNFNAPNREEDAQVTEQQIAIELSKRNHTHGYSYYWLSSSVSRFTNGQVSIASVQRLPENWQPFYYLTKRSWFDKPATFLIWPTEQKAPGSPGGLTAEQVIEYFGEPQEIVTIDTMNIYFFNQPINDRIHK